jgi:peptide/nickel transport system permease protein
MQTLRRFSHARIRRLARDRRVPFAALALAVVFLAALFAPVIAPYDPIKMGVGPLLAAPSPAHLMGLDNYGRDEFSRVIFGARLSLSISALVAVSALIIGTVAGMAAGFYGSYVDGVISRLVDVVLAFPWVLVAMAMAIVVGPGLKTVVLALLVVYSPMMIRLARGAILAERQRDYVTSAVASGAGTGRILFRHILPNIASPLLVVTAGIMSFVILDEASLSYLGLGAQPPTPSWGLMLSESGFYLGRAPHMAIFPGIAIIILVLGLNLLADALRDELDPRLRGSGL